MDLSEVELAEEQEQDRNLRLMKDMIQNSPERPFMGTCTCRMH